MNKVRRCGVCKRALDLLIALPALLILLPVLCLVALVVRIQLGGPIFFAQERPGRHGRPFRLVKFRTMTEQRDAEGRLLDDDQRLTKFGKVLRLTSIDELPELWNVITGEMSLVGPRPLLMHYLPLYSTAQARRHEVRPGITGWAQVNGRNAVSWDEKFAMDVWYVDNRSMALDLRILAMTVIRVLRPRGVSQAGRVTADEFRGNRQ
jgi:lipopolysaccharide/colanic/teichoic acid biosynthesis glycosyltransferase